MTTLKIISETPIMLAQLKEDLARIKQRDGELNFRASKTEEYLNQFVGLSGEKAEEIAKKIESLDIPRLKPEHIAKIVDLMPNSLDEMKTILSSYTITVSAENVAAIVEAVKPYLAENKATIDAYVPPAAPVPEVAEKIEEATVAVSAEPPAAE
ncbi:MAG: hypothetical protein Q7R76_06005 [Candidatus Woesearchaeota archaeon]|nr:hypothetical protein [Candidatus Woesearchaeota archaeon]